MAAAISARAETTVARMPTMMPPAFSPQREVQKLTVADLPRLAAWRQEPRSRMSVASVIYVCGATLASEQAVGFAFGDGSWADALAEADIEVWGFDFAGFGRSERYPEMS